MTVILVVVVTSAALIAGALWGAYGKLPDRLEGFLVALAGGALIVAIIEEMVNPAVEVLPLAY
ncbi:MAG: zinc transporter, partial [Pseudomonadota bacterium]|nr:zinc transporter [Pseudomonadota bacterium]